MSTNENPNPWRHLTPEEQAEYAAEFGEQDWRFVWYNEETGEVQRLRVGSPEVRRMLTATEPNPNYRPA